MSKSYLSHRKYQSLSWKKTVIHLRRNPLYLGFMTRTLFYSMFKIGIPWCSVFKMGTPLVLTNRVTKTRLSALYYVQIREETGCALTQQQELQPGGKRKYPGSLMPESHGKLSHRWLGVYFNTYGHQTELHTRAAPNGPPRSPAKLCMQL